MKSFRTIVAFVVLGLTPPGQLLCQNSIIQNIVNKVSGDSIFGIISKIEHFERYTLSNDTGCSNYLKKRFEKFHFDTIYFQYYNPDWLPNIIAVKYGILHPDSIYVAGAHYDSYKVGAPGADDNGSGTSGIIEIARVFADCKFKKTMFFTLFSGEELGDYGSKAFVDSLANNNNHVSAMLDLDMIAYVNPGDDTDVSICVNTLSLGLMNKYIQSSAAHVPGLSYVVDSTSTNVIYSDQKSFWQKNIPALFLIDESDIHGPNFNYHVHTPDDTVGLSANSSILAEEITRSAAATLINLAEIETTSFPVIPVSYRSMFEVYPNPATDVVHINLETQAIGPVRIEIFNALGKSVCLLNSAEKENSLDFSKTPEGVYLIKLSCKHFTRIMKIIKE